MGLFYDIKKAFISWVADIRIYCGGIVLFGESHYKIKGPHMREIINIIQPGDLILRRFNHYLGSLAIPGYWSHSAIYVGDEHDIIHMLGTGITREDILTFMRCDDIVVLRCPDAALVSGAIRESERLMVNMVEYDYNFNTSCSEKFYCTEFCNYVYGNPILKSGVIVPDDMLDSIWEIVWEK